MSFRLYEEGAASAQPVELYHWSHAGSAYRYTSDQEARSHAGASYAPAPITREALAQGDAIERAELKVTLTADHPVAALFVAGPPADRVHLTLYRLHASDPAGEVLSAWAGRVRSCTWAGGEVVLLHEPVFTALRRPGLRRTWGLQCPHVLGDYWCGVDLASYALSDTITRVAGLVVTLPDAGSKPNGYWAAGVCAVTIGGVLHRVMIDRHTGTRLTLHMPVQGLAAGQTATITPGCDHSLKGPGGCITRFGNALNYGGFPWTPVTSPYGSRIY